MLTVCSVLVLTLSLDPRSQSGAAPFSFMAANTALRCHNNKAARSSRAAADGAVGRHL